MRTFLRIKWETIMTLALLILTIYGWLSYINYQNDVKMLAMACITNFMFLMVFSSYKTIKSVRHETLKLWL